MRKLAVRTNWPTVALKPERKALKGCGIATVSSLLNASYSTPSLAFTTKGKEEQGRTHKVTADDAVEELQGADGDEEDHEDVEQLGALVRLVDVVPPHAVGNGLGIVRIDL